MDVVALTVMRLIPAVLEMLSAWKTALLAKSYVSIKLFSSNVAIGPGTGLSALTEATYPGYAPVVLSSLNGPSLDTTNIGYLTTPEAYFTCTGGGVSNTIYSAGIVATLAGGTAATGTATVTGGAIATVTITAGGAGYTAPPQITVTGGGTGAVVTATLTAGVVTALTIISPGTGYTAPTLVIEPPVELLHGANLTSPRIMALSTDALPLVLQINNPPGA